MVDLNLSDVGGVDPSSKEMITDELIGFIDGLNPKLGTKDDPYRDEWQAFMSEIASAGVVTIDPDSMSSGRFDDIDLSGADEEIREIPDSFYTEIDTSQITPLLLLAALTPFDGEVVDGFSFSNVFTTPFGDYEEFVPGSK